MKNCKAKLLSILLIVCMSGLFALSGCQPSCQPPSSPSDVGQGAPPNSKTVEESEADRETPSLPGVSMTGALTLDSSSRDNLGWSGVMNVQINSATIYRSYNEAKDHVGHLVAGKDALKDAPILICEVYLDNHDARSDAQDEKFRANFMFLGPDRIPVTFFAAPEQSERTDSSGSDSMAFSLPKGDSTIIYVGFSVPQTWFDGSADMNNRDYIAFGGSKEEYHRVGEGVVPNHDFIWLTTSVCDGKDQSKTEK